MACRIVSFRQILDFSRIALDILCISEYHSDLINK